MIATEVFQEAISLKNEIDLFVIDPQNDSSSPNSNENSSTSLSAEISSLDLSETNQNKAKIKNSELQKIDYENDELLLNDLLSSWTLSSILYFTELLKEKQVIHCTDLKELEHVFFWNMYSLNIEEEVNNEKCFVMKCNFFSFAKKLKKAVFFSKSFLENSSTKYDSLILPDLNLFIFEGDNNELFSFESKKFDSLSKKNGTFVVDPSNPLKWHEMEISHLDDFRKSSKLANTFQVDLCCVSADQFIDKCFILSSQINSDQKEDKKEEKSKRKKKKQKNKQVKKKKQQQNKPKMLDF